MPTGENKRIGKWGEDQACAFLERQGFTVVERNYHATVGEIDIIATKAGDYYFLEVKTRQAGDLAYDTAITGNKKLKLQKTIKHYCYHRQVEGSTIPTSLMVVFSRQNKTIQFRLAVLY